MLNLSVFFVTTSFFNAVETHQIPCAKTKRFEIVVEGRISWCNSNFIVLTQTRSRWIELVNINWLDHFQIMYLFQTRNQQQSYSSLKPAPHVQFAFYVVYPAFKVIHDHKFIRGWLSHDGTNIQLQRFKGDGRLNVPNIDHIFLTGARVPLWGSITYLSTALICTRQIGIKETQK